MDAYKIIFIVACLGFIFYLWRAITMLDELSNKLNNLLDNIQIIEEVGDDENTAN